MQQKGKTGLRKRQQIAKAGKTVFAWVAIVSVVVGFCLVGGWFLLQKGIYTGKVIAKKTETLSSLEHNNSIVDELKDNVRALNTNTRLNSLKTSDDDQAVRVVMDALPAEVNSLALGASLQNNLLAGIPGLNILTLNVTPVAGVESGLEDTGTTPDAAVDPTLDPVTGEPIEYLNTINFTLSVQGSPDSLRQVLERLERSIRSIVVTQQVFESGEDNVHTLTIQGHSYYEPAKKVELREEVVQP